MTQTNAKRYTAYKYAFIPRETQDFASHKRVFRKPMRYNISHLIMLLFLGRRKILRLYKADDITIKGNMEPDDALYHHFYACLLSVRRNILRLYRVRRKDVRKAPSQLSSSMRSIGLTASRATVSSTLTSGHSYLSVLYILRRVFIFIYSHSLHIHPTVPSPTSGGTG